MRLCWLCEKPGTNANPLEHDKVNAFCRCGNHSVRGYDRHSGCEIPPPFRTCHHCISLEMAHR